MTHRTVLLQTIFDDENTVTAQSTQLTTLDFKQDPVALAWAGYRHSKENGTRWHDIHTVTATEHDHDMSAKIRRYYSDRIMFGMLQQQTISEFRRKLYGVVSNTATLAAKDIGLLYRLPYFYLEDLAVDRVVEQCVSAHDHATARICEDFSLLEAVEQSRAGNEASQFWLITNNSQAAYMLTVKTNNPYHRLISNLVQKPVRLSAWAHVKTHRGHHRNWKFFQLSDIELIK